MIELMLQPTCLRILITVCAPLVVSIMVGCGLGGASNQAGAAADPNIAAIHECFDAYEKAVLNQDGTAAVKCVNASTLDYYQRMRDLALTGDAQTVQRLSIFDKVIVLQMRLRVPKGTLQGMTRESAFAYGIEKGWTDKSGVKQNSLGQVQVTGPDATGVHVFRGQPTEVRWKFQFENGEWKIDLFKFQAGVGAKVFEQMARQSGKSENAYVLELLEAVTGKRIDQTVWQPLVR